MTTRPIPLCRELTRHNPGSTLRMVSAVRLSVGRTRRSVQRSGDSLDVEFVVTETKTYALLLDGSRPKAQVQAFVLPIARKKIVEAVAAPICARGATFCTATE